METLVIPVIAVLAALGVGGVKVTSSSRSMLVERLGKYNRQLQPGLWASSISTRPSPPARR